MRDVSNKIEQYKDIVKLKFEIIKKLNNNYKDLNQIVDIIYLSPAPKNYVSYAEARRFVSRIHNKKSIKIKNKERLDMYHSIYNKWYKYITDNNIKSLKYKYSILDTIINNEAPSFFLSKYRIKEILYYNENGYK